MVYAGQQEECFNQEAGSSATTVSPQQHMVMEKLAVESIIYITLSDFSFPLICLKYALKRNTFIYTPLKLTQRMWSLQPLRRPF